MSGRKRKRGMDGTFPPENPGTPQPKWMQAIVIGGAANGLILPKVMTNATTIELTRPDHLKPLAYSKQETPEVATVSDKYDVCTTFLANEKGGVVPFGIIVLQGKSMRWAFSELVRGFAQNVLNELSAENLQQ